MPDATPRAAGSPPAFGPNEILAARYRIVRLLGAGGMGEVYEAVDLELDERIALKVVRHANPAFATDSRLIQELQLARRIPHPSICRLYHIDRDRRAEGELLFITMELLEGGTLAQRLAHEGPLAPETAVAVGLQLAAALDAAHTQGVIHRDLKPSNIMFGNNGRAVITDFGLARAKPEPDEATATATGPAGTLAYMAPEVLRGGRATVASDIYALGVVLHEMVTGRQPVPAATGKDLVAPSALRPGVPAAWDRVIAGCLAHMEGGGGCCDRPFDRRLAPLVVVRCHLAPAAAATLRRAHGMAVASKRSQPGDRQECARCDQLAAVPGRGVGGKPDGHFVG